MKAGCSSFCSGGPEERLVTDLTEPYGQPALRCFVPTFAFRPPDRLEIADAFDVAEEIPLWVLVHFTDEPARGPAAPPGRPLLLPPSAPILPL